MAAPKQWHSKLCSRRVSALLSGRLWRFNWIGLAGRDWCRVWRWEARQRRCHVGAQR